MKVFDFEQYSPEWWNIRRGVPTASNFNKIMTPKKRDYSSAAEGYIAALIGDALFEDYGNTDDYVSAAMRNGTLMEPEARAWYQVERGERVTQVGFCLDDDIRFGCSPDGLVGEAGGLELKSPTPATQVEWLLSDGVPDKHLNQVHGALIITGRKWWDFMSYCRGLPTILTRVEPDEHTEALRACMEQFWTEYQAKRAQIDSMEIAA